VVDEVKTVKNRLHFDLGVSGGRTVPLETRKQRVEAEAERLSRLGATRIQALFEKGLDHYAVAMLDPEGNEFDINWVGESVSLTGDARVRWHDRDERAPTISEL
jgi:hypothetical protein